MTDTIEQDVFAMIADVLALEPDEVRPEARFLQDLNGESIELLELSFRCEKRFGVPVRFQEMLDQKSLIADSDGRLSQQSLDWLRREYPFLDLSEFARDPRMGRMTDLLTNRAIVEFVRRCVNSAPRTGHAATA